MRKMRTVSSIRFTKGADNLLSQFVVSTPISVLFRSVGNFDEPSNISAGE